MRVTGAPVLSLKTIIEKPKNDNLFMLLKKFNIRYYILYGYGRFALLNGLILLDIKRGDNILVPAYICDIALEPLYDLGIKPVFYDII